MKEKQKVIFCHCDRAQLVPAETRAVLLEYLRNRGDEVVETGDLCELAAKKSPELALLSRESNLHVAACYPRAVRWLCAAAGTPLGESAVVLNMREKSAAQIITLLEGASGENKAQSAKPGVEPVSPHSGAAASVAGWLPWFPVIDFDRCTQCMQCLSFCLFSVFSVTSDRKIFVENPENCKPNCPACARVCPQTAILFPKHKAPPINGDTVPDRQSEPKTKVDISSFLGGDMYRFLRDRNQRQSERFSAERDPQAALEERRKCLAQLRELGDIPPEVLMSLPSESEMKKRADAAAARARQVLGSQSAEGG